MRWRFEYLGLLLLVMVTSCGSANFEDAEPPLDPDLGKSYFFLAPNKYREYDVFEIRYLAVDISDTLEYQLREEVRDSFNVNGVESRIIHRLTRDDATQPWALDSVWSSRVERVRAISIENNVPLQKMVFPVDTSQRWDRNLFNSNPALVQKYLTFDQPFTQGFNTFLKATVVEVANDRSTNPDGIDVTFRDVRTEVYADSIGLVRKEYEQLKFCTVGPCALQEIVQSGRYYIETLTAHGFIDEDGN